MLIDFHTHCFPEKIAKKAIDKLSFASGGLEPCTDGSLEGLKSSMRQNNVDISVVMNIATNEGQQQKVNDFAASINNKKDIFSFGSVFPSSANALCELERIKELGLLGVKLHPDYQDFFVDDEKMKPIYKKISQLGLVVLFHAGFDYGFAPPYGCTPERLARALHWLDTPVVAAHFGGLNCCEGVLEHLCGKDVYIDTSFGYGALPKYYAQKIIDKHTSSRVLFGTDTPWHTPQNELRLLNTLELSCEDMDNITHKNAKKLLKI